MIDARTPVVVAYAGGHGALAVARSLGRLGVRVYLVAGDGAGPLARSRYWAGHFRWDFAAARADDSIAFLLQVARRLGDRPVLLTMADAVAALLEAHRDALLGSYLMPEGAPGAVRALADKWRMFALAREHGIPTPHTAFPQTRDEAQAFADAALFPVVVKAADPGAAFVPRKAIVAARDALLERYDADAACGAPNAIFQEFVPGGPEQVWMCNAYFGRGSRCRIALTGRKLRQVSDTGIASLAVSETNPLVAEQTVRLMQGVGYEGPVGVGYRYDARDGAYKLLDVNARVSGIFRLFVTAQGFDPIRVAYLDLTGQPVDAEALAAVEGRKWMLEDDLAAAFAQWRAGRLTLAQWAASMRGISETHWFAADDVAPGLAWAGGLWPGFARRVVRLAARLTSRFAAPRIAARS